MTIQSPVVGMSSRYTYDIRCYGGAGRICVRRASGVSVMDSVEATTAQSRGSLAKRRYGRTSGPLEYVGRSGGQA
jgi:hypothetical protein